MHFAHDLLRRQTVGVLTAWGMAQDYATIAATAIIDADLAGIDSHGVSMLPGYQTLLDKGHLAPWARTTVVRENPATAVLDAGGGLGHPAAVTAMQLATDKALELGVGVVSVRNSQHFGATGYYAGLAAERGVIALVTTSARSVCVTPTRGAVPRLPTNPLAFAAPAKRNRPFLLDMSTSTVAVNKVKVYGYADRALPAGWVLDGNGDSVPQPHEALRLLRSAGQGGLTPLGGTSEMSSHKGYGLAMMVQILSATLCGAGFAAARGADEPADIGHFFLALDPVAFRDDGGFQEDLDDALDLLRATPPVEQSRPVLVPGDPEASARAERLRTGIPITAALRDQLRAICEPADTAFLLTDAAATPQPAR